MCICEEDETCLSVYEPVFLIFHALLACLINFAIEAISRHSLVQAWSYMTQTPLVFLYNAFMIFMTFTVVYLFRRRVFTRIIIGVLWMILGICNGYMLMKRVTPFNAQDLKVATDAVSLINNYFNGFEIVIVLVGIAAVIIWLISMWRRGGQYEGKIHRLLAIAGVAVCAVYSASQQIRQLISECFPHTLEILRLPMRITDFRTALCPVYLIQESMSRMDIRRKQWQRLTRTEN